MSTGKTTATLRRGGSLGSDLEAMITETAEDARRLGLADTQVRGFNPEITTSTSLPPAITASLSREKVAPVLKLPSAASIRRSASLFAVVMIISAGLFLYLFPRAEIIEQKALEQTVTFSVSAIDPAMDKGAVKNAIAEAKSIALDKALPQKGPIIGPGGRNFAYAREPRTSGNPSFGVMPGSGSSYKRGAAGGSGLQPVQNSEGRFLSRSGLEWQGSWESANPAGNIRRGEGYLRYLRSQFSGDASRALTSRDTGLAAVGRSVSAPPPREIPALRYSE